MAGGAGAVAPARVVEPDSVVQGHVQQRLLLAMILIGKFAVLKRNSLALRKECDLYRILARGIHRGRPRSLRLFVRHSRSYLKSAFATGCPADGPSPISASSIVFP